MELTYLQFSSVRQLKKFREYLPPRRVVIQLAGNILLSEFTEKEIELALTLEASLSSAEMVGYETVIKAGKEADRGAVKQE